MASVWFKNGYGTTASGQLFNWVDADATLGNWRMGGECARSLGPVLNRGVLSRKTTSAGGAVYTLSAYAQDVLGITAGAETLMQTADASGFVVGQYVRPLGTFTGLSGITSGRDYRINSIAGDTLSLALSTTGTWAEGLTATVKWSTWQPESWNLAVLSFTDTPTARLRHMGGHFGGPLSLLTESLGTTGERPIDIFSALDRICLGAILQSDSATGHLCCEFSDLAIWNNVEPTALQATELLTMAPNLVSFGAPTAYWPLLADENDTIGSAHLTLVGSPTISSDGPAITRTGGGGSTGFLQHIMRSHNPSVFGVR